MLEMSKLADACGYIHAAYRDASTFTAVPFKLNIITRLNDELKCRPAWLDLQQPATSVIPLTQLNHIIRKSYRRSEYPGNGFEGFAAGAVYNEVDQTTDAL